MYNQEETEVPYVGVVKLITGETIIATVECLEDFTYRFSDPLKMDTMPIMTSKGIQMTEVATPWLKNSINQSFIVAESSVVTIGEVRPKLFEDYVNIVNSDLYNEQFNPLEMSYDSQSETSTLNNPILNKFKNNLENCFKL